MTWAHVPLAHDVRSRVSQDSWNWLIRNVLLEISKADKSRFALRPNMHCGMLAAEL